MTSNNNSRVRVDSILSAMSNKPIEAGKIHTFSLLDQTMVHQTIHLVFYYTSDPFGPMSWDLSNLRDSLSRALDYYPVATGRLNRAPDGGWYVKCNDAGIRMLRANVDATLDEWLRSSDSREEEDLTVWEDMPGDPTYWSPFRIQINNFKCGGLGLGVSCTHMHADITSVTLLIKSWAQAHQPQPISHPPTFHLPAATTTATASKTTPSRATAVHSSSTFKFPACDIQKALSRVQDHCPDATPFDVLTALFWSRIAPAEPIRVCVDSRAHEGAPPGYFGNAFCFSDLGADELGRACERIHKHVEGLKKGGDFLGWLENNESDDEGSLRMYGPMLTFVDAGSTEMYEVEFHKGERPIRVSCRVGNVEGEGLIVVMPSDEGGLGRTVTVALPQDRINELRIDQILQDMSH